MESAINVNQLPWTWPRWRKWTFYLICWTIPAFVALSYYHLNQILTATEVNWNYALMTSLPWWYIWALFTPVVLWVARKYPINKDTWVKSVPLLYIPLMLLLFAVHAAINLLLFRATGIHDTMNMALLEVHFTSRMHVNTMAFWTVLGFYNAFDYYRKYQLREQQAANLELQLARANLRALKMQLNPHFLFNTLHSVSALVRKNENAIAIKMLGRLGEFLRLALENQGTQLIPLEEELDFLERYLEIEKIRFQERLEVDMDVDLDLLDYYVPNLILQPIVENAIHHGISPHIQAGKIKISAFKEDEHLVLQVHDDGPGLTNTRKARQGVGLSNTRERLERLYGDDQQLALINAEEGGLKVRIVIPMQREIEGRFASTPGTDATDLWK